MKVPLFDAAREHRTLSGELASAAESVLSSGAYILGSKVEAFEQEVGAYLGVSHAIGVASGSDALWLALRSLGTGPGQRVVTSPFTFFATAEAIVATGAEPVFVDIDPHTLTLDPRRVAQLLEGRSPVHRRLGIRPDTITGLLPVHLYGQAGELDALLSLARRGLAVVEDAAQAFGAEYRGRKLGTFGDLGCFSFFPTKNLGGYGDGGLVVTQNDHLAREVRALRLHGADSKYRHRLVGRNSRLDALQAALLAAKLPYLEAALAARWAHAAAYDAELAGVPGVLLPREGSGCRHTYCHYTIRVLGGRRDEVRSELAERGVQTAVHYDLPLHLQEALGGLGYREGDLPEAEQASREVLSLPIFPSLREDERRYVSESLLRIMTGGGRKANRTQVSGPR